MQRVRAGIARPLHCAPHPPCHRCALPARFHATEPPPPRPPQFICCAGWDRNLYVFLDAAEGEAPVHAVDGGQYLYKLPKARLAANSVANASPTGPHARRPTRPHVHPHTHPLACAGRRARLDSPHRRHHQPRVLSAVAARDGRARRSHHRLEPELGRVHRGPGPATGLCVVSALPPPVRRARCRRVRCWGQSGVPCCGGGGGGSCGRWPLLGALVAMAFTLGHSPTFRPSDERLILVYDVKSRRSNLQVGSQHRSDAGARPGAARPLMGSPPLRAARRSRAWRPTPRRTCSSPPTSRATCGRGT